MRPSRRVEINYFVMRIHLLLVAASVAAALPAAQARPFENGQFKGRIAYSCDGNHNDPDDWIASPVALAIFAEAGLRDRVVHFDYNSILPLTNAEWEKTHAESVLGGAKHYGYDLRRFFDDRKDLDGAIASIVKAINASSAADPLYFIIAGPMEVPYRALQQADRSKLEHVYCISHSRWNDGYQPTYKFSFTKRSVIEQGVHWVQIKDQNRLLSHSKYGTPAKPGEFAPYFWMRDSKDPKVRFLWARMQVSTRPDPSDAGMAWFLVTGDEECDPAKLEQLLQDHRAPVRIAARSSVRIEAENFRHIEGFAVEDRHTDRTTSHRLAVRLDRPAGAKITSRFDEPFAQPSGRYDVEVRYSSEKGGAARFALFVDGTPRGAAWNAGSGDRQWESHVIAGVDLKFGGELAVNVEGAAAWVDYVQLNPPGTAPQPPAEAAPRAPAKTSKAEPSRAAPATLDDPQAMPGGLIVAGANPGHLKYNGGRPVFLCGPDNPEEFLYLGTLHPDGTRSGGGQSEMIARMARSGVNAFHCLIFRMQRCNFKKEGDDQHCPFVDHDPAKPLNDAVLAQWEGWLTELERAGINVDFELYNDATDVELMGWQLDAKGNLHPDEHRFVTGIVNRFKHHKNILWSIEESCNKLPRARTAHFKKIGEVIAKTDNYHHPIVQSFVVPGDPEGDFPKDGVTTDDYAGDPNIRVITWLHVVPNGKDYEKQHAAYLQFANLDRKRFVAMKNETFHHPRNGVESRRYMWSCAMTGLHTLEAYHHAGGVPKNPKYATEDATLREDGLLRRFMEQTDFYQMSSNDALAAGSTKWVLARPGESYIAYTYDYWGPMGLKSVHAGTYDLLWFDPQSVAQVEQKSVPVKTSSPSWSKPATLGNEIALYLKRTGEGARTAANP